MENFRLNMNYDSAKRYPLVIATLIGFSLIAWGSTAGEFHPILKDAIVGAGASIIASVVFFFVFFNKEDLAHRVTRCGVISLFSDRHNEFRTEFWVNLLDVAQRQILILGVANHGYVDQTTGLLKTRELRAITKSLQDKKITLTILWLNPKGSNAKARDSEEDRGTRADTMKSIKTFYEFRNTFEESIKSRIHLKMYDAVPTCGVTWVDNHIIVTHYLSHRPNSTSPGFVLTYSRTDKVLNFLSTKSENGALFKVYRDNVEAIENSSALITADVISGFESFARTLPVNEDSEADIAAKTLNDKSQN